MLDNFFNRLDRFFTYLYKKKIYSYNEFSPINDSVSMEIYVNPLDNYVIYESAFLNTEQEIEFQIVLCSYYSNHIQNSYHLQIPHNTILVNNEFNNIYTLQKEFIKLPNNYLIFLKTYANDFINSLSELELELI